MITNHARTGNSGRLESKSQPHILPIHSLHCYIAYAWSNVESLSPFSGDNMMRPTSNFICPHCSISSCYHSWLVFNLARCFSTLKSPISSDWLDVTCEPCMEVPITCDLRDVFIKNCWELRAKWYRHSAIVFIRNVVDSKNTMYSFLCASVCFIKDGMAK